MEDKTYRFEYRFELKLMQEINRICKKLRISKTELMRQALHEATDYYAGGVFHHLQYSDFLLREDKVDKLRFEVVLDEDERDVLRKLAFTWGESQAEVMRVVVEYFVYVLHGDSAAVAKVYTDKIRYTQPVAAPMVVVYDILNVLEARYYMFRPPKAWKLFIT